MTLPKRNSRPIDIDGTVFRWTVGARSQLDTGTVNLLVEPPENGQRLIVEIPCPDRFMLISTGEEFQDRDVLAVTPRLVRKLILDAKNLGWTPEKKCKQFEIENVQAEMKNEGGEAGATGHVRWQCPSCDQWYSEDVHYNEKPPILSACGRTKHHHCEKQRNAVLFW